jgi:hypothetical protein
MVRNKAHLTAISRRTLSAPMRHLNSLALIPQTSKSLDYGCGRGFDADQLGMDKFDPYHFPQATSPAYDVVTCNYVLNVIESEAERSDVITKLLGNTRCGGVIYVSVRNDLKALNGITSKGTWQGNIDDLELEAHGFYKIKQTSNFRMFKYRKHNQKPTK